MSNKDIPDYGPITYFLERVFYGMQYTSLAILFFGTTSEKRGLFKGPSDHHAFDIWRARCLDGYMIAWLLVEIAIALLFTSARAPVYYLLLILVAYRMFDIFQSSVNMNVFNHLRRGPNNYKITNFTRALILSLWTYFELAFCFGIIYSSSIHQLIGAEKWWDAYYFSIITQLTIGYGDIQPDGMMKLLASLQGLFGFLLALVVIGRFVSFLPKPGEATNQKN